MASSAIAVATAVFRMGRRNNIFETMFGVSFSLSHWLLSHPARSGAPFRVRLCAARIASSPCLPVFISGAR